LHVLARIFFLDEEISIRGCFGPGKNVIVPFSLNSPDSGYTGIFPKNQIVQNGSRLTKGDHFEIGGIPAREVLPKEVFSDVRGGRKGGGRVWTR
jgi:hypothetical protein